MNYYGLRPPYGPTYKAKEITAMKLYQNWERITTEVRELEKNMKKGETLKVTDLYPIDSMHYNGVETVRDTMKQILPDLRGNSEGPVKVLDFGSGFGGTARFLAAEMDCDVTAVELQRKPNEIAEELTEKVGLKDRVKHICADMMNLKPEQEEEIGLASYDVLTSYLVFLHIDEKKEVFETCAKFLKKGAPNGSVMVIEDYFKNVKKVNQIKVFNGRDEKLLREEAFCEPNHLLTQPDYVAALKEAGFTDIDFQDVTDEWSLYVKERFDTYVKNKEALVKLHSEATYKNQHKFYESMNTLFIDGNGKQSRVRGARIICRLK